MQGVCYGPKNSLKLCGNCIFPQNPHTRKLDQILVFSAVNCDRQVTENHLNIFDKKSFWKSLIKKNFVQQTFIDLNGRFSK